MKPTNQDTGQKTVKITPKTPFARFFFKGLVTGRSFFFVTSLAAPHRLLRLLQIRGDGSTRWRSSMPVGEGRSVEPVRP